MDIEEYHKSVMETLFRILHVSGCDLRGHVTSPAHFKCKHNSRKFLTDNIFFYESYGLGALRYSIKTNVL